MNKNIKENENIHELLGYERIKIIQRDEMFSFSLDSMLLANFIDVTNAKRIIDLLPPKIADKLKIIIRVFVNKCFRRPKVESVSLQTTNNKKDVQNEFLALYKELII